MNRRGLATAVIILIIVAVLVAIGIWYYETQKANLNTTQMSSSVSAESASPSVTLAIDGSHGPVLLPLGTWFSIAWTLNGAHNCSSTGAQFTYPSFDPTASMGSSTQEWMGGGGSITDTSTDYQITCATPSGNTVSDTVEVETLPINLTLAPSDDNWDPNISNPNQVPSSAKNYLLNSFEVQMGAVGTYLTDISIMPSQDIVSGKLSIDPNSLKALVFAAAPPGNVWFLDSSDYGPPYDHSGGSDAVWQQDVRGLVWLPANSSATIEIFGDITNAELGTYKKPLSIGLYGAGDLNTLFQLDKLSDNIGSYWTTRYIGDYPLPTLTTSPNPTSATQPNQISGQDIQIVP